MFLRSLILLCAVISHSLAYPKITTPAAGASLTGGSTISIKWSDEGTAPSISDLSTYQLFLCAGSNDEFTQLATLVSSGDFSDGNTASGSITTGIGGSVTNA
ncbi:MAG: hypothetical protein M1834_000594 [Cirrosporium novae-zelandiae]|nr:MAG: hypothetical protein M1834_000594 [Cirrosporium novae-zelandiae]